MRKKFNFLVVGFLVFISVLLNVILFLTLPEGRSGEGVFWLVWAFTFPVNLIIGITTFLVANKKSADSAIRVPLVLYVVLAAFVVYILGGFCFFFYAKEINVVWAIIFEAVVTFAYISLLVFLFFGLTYIERNQKHTKEKVLFIRLLKADIDSCLPYADEKSALLLKRLSEKVRFSDPMSSPMLKDCESEISTLVMSLRVRMKDGDSTTVEKDVKQIESLLDYRNERCKILK